METKVEEKKNILQKINATTPAQLATLPEVAERFKSIYSVMNGRDMEKAAAKYEAEKFHFQKSIQDKPDLQSCTKLSLYGCFLDMAVNGLSFDPTMKHAYMVSFNINTGTQASPKWEKRAQLMISGYGELHMRVQQKQIKYADNPILVYEGDKFKHGTSNGHVLLEHEAIHPRKADAEIIACYLRIERIDGSIDYKVLGIDEVMNFKKYSKNPNGDAWNKDKGLPGMIQAKTLKHAFKAYPKMRLGEFSQLVTNIVDEDAEVLPKVDYGVPVENATSTSSSSIEDIEPIVDEKTTSTAKVEAPADNSFVKKEDKKSSSTTFEDDNF